MKYVICCLVVFAATPSVAQQTLSKADSLLLQSVSPITWSMTFSCYPTKQSYTCNNATPTWNGSVELWSYPPNIFVTISVSPGPIYTINSADTTPDNNRSSTANINLDTIKRTVSLNYSEADISKEMQESFEFQATPYSIVGTKRQAVSNVSANYHPLECTCGGGGWVTIGGASPPADVAPSKIVQSPAIKIIALGGNTVRFLFTSTLNQSIRILDLLGRERAVIPIAPGAESAELNTSRLSPGIYFAVLGGQVVKFVVE